MNFWFGPHMYVENIKRKAIKAERENAKKDPHHLILQIDLAENWAVIHNKAVQGNHWVNDQISIFTAVSYQGDSTQCFAVIRFKYVIIYKNIFFFFFHSFEDMTNRD